MTNLETAVAKFKSFLDSTDCDHLYHVSVETLCSLIAAAFEAADSWTPFTLSLGDRTPGYKEPYFALTVERDKVTIEAATDWSEEAEREFFTATF